MIPPSRVFSTVYLGMASVVPVGGFRDAVINDAQGCFCGIVQGNSQGFFFQCGESGQHPVRQFKLRMRLGAHTDFYPGKFLGPYFLDDGLDAVVTAGRAVGPDPEPSRLQGNVVNRTMIR